MKKTVKRWIRALILWAAGDYYKEAAEQLSADMRAQLHHSRDHLAKENGKQWRLINSKIAALQAIDCAGHGYAGKLILVATVRGQDIVKIFDIPREMSLEHHRAMVADIEDRYGARLDFLDADPSTRGMLENALERSGHPRRRRPPGR